MIKQQYVYHCSKIKGLKRLEPKPSTHKVPWVYATKDIAISAMFLGDNFDFICQTGINNGQPTITERFKGAFEYAYKNKTGSIYYLKPDTFEEGKTGWSPEIVSDVAVDVIKEVEIADVYEFLQQLEKNGKITIYRFPNHTERIPDDESDIVERGIQWTLDFGESTLDQVQKFHPDVLNKVIDGLKKMNYRFKDSKWEKFN